MRARAREQSTAAAAAPQSAGLPCTVHARCSQDVYPQGLSLYIGRHGS